jgi:hypothetical protein
MERTEILMITSRRPAGSCATSSGIWQQIEDGVNGFLVSSVEEAAAKIVHSFD